MDKKSEIQLLKSKSGSHSPSIETILELIGEEAIHIDACFLSNPYATELFWDRLALLQENRKAWLRRLEFYPPQNKEIAKRISNATGIDRDRILVGNGAIELIQSVISREVRGKMCVILPTFSPYYEFVNEYTEVIYYHLSHENGFHLDIKDYIAFVKENNINNVVIINPNNPDGGYISQEKLELLCREFASLDNVIIDESFVHFAYEEDALDAVSLENKVEDYANVVIIKSMSKDFGIAGIRAGYLVGRKSLVNRALSGGYLWNVSGLADFFFTLYEDADFRLQYEIVRKKYIRETKVFFDKLAGIVSKAGGRVFESKANFVLIRLPDDLQKSSSDVMVDLLVDYGIYVRECSDKKGLEGSYLRIASRTEAENTKMISSLTHYLDENI